MLKLILENSPCASRHNHCHSKGRTLPTPPSKCSAVFYSLKITNDMSYLLHHDSFCLQSTPEVQLIEFLM